MKKHYFSGWAVLLLFTAILSSCEKDPPVCDFTFVADGLTVTFTANATNADSYAWDFGDETTGTEKNPVHTYAAAGDFEVELTAKGEGGSDKKKQTVTVTVGLEDVKVWLTGGPSDSDGKTWVLKSEVVDGDGASAVEPSMLVLIPVPADFFPWLGNEGKDGKKDEFTFKYDGSYSIETNNDTVTSISIFAFVNGITVPNSNSPYGTCRATPFTEPAGATWTLGEEDFVVDAITNPSDVNVPPTHANATFTGKRWLSFSAGAFFGFLDFTTSGPTSKVIIKSISPTEMKVALMVCMYGAAAQPGGIAYANLPTHLYHMTFVAK
ncbi:MAG: PKD domain-containing protein [Bacteroidales bacterium]